MKKTALIMAGGKGERFWPRSRVNLPKQFLLTLKMYILQQMLIIESLLKNSFQVFQKRIFSVNQ